MNVNITQADFLGILPVLLLSGFGVILMVLSVYSQRFHRMTIPYLGVVGIVLALIANFFLIGRDYLAFQNMVRVDWLTVAFNFIFLVTAGLSLLLTTSYSEQEHVEFIEFTPLLMFATVGMMLMGAAQNLMMIFLGLETMSIALYVMAGFRRTNRESLEAALKYFLLGAFATGFLLYGIALIYGTVGSTSFPAIVRYLTKNALSPGLLFLVGTGLLIVGFGFKVALVPFHMWTPDVYQGSPMPVTAYMAVGAKAAGFAAIIRFFTLTAAQIAYQWVDVLWILAVLTMTVGNVLALVQKDIKRMLAYSSIAHAGYLLVGIVADNDLTVPAVMFYLVAYLLMNLGAFAIALIVSGTRERRTRIEYFKGLAETQPMLALAMAICMVSLAGFPPTIGFMGKFYLFSAALYSGYLWLVIIGVINSLISVYYYIGVVVAMYMHKPVDDRRIEQVVPGVGLVVLIAVVGIFVFGIFPGSLAGLFG